MNEYMKVSRHARARAHARTHARAFRIILLDCLRSRIPQVSEGWSDFNRSLGSFRSMNAHQLQRQGVPHGIVSSFIGHVVKDIDGKAQVVTVTSRLRTVMQNTLTINCASLRVFSGLATEGLRVRPRLQHGGHDQNHQDHRELVQALVG